MLFSGAIGAKTVVDQGAIRNIPSSRVSVSNTRTAPRGNDMPLTAQIASMDTPAIGCPLSSRQRRGAWARVPGPRGWRAETFFPDQSMTYDLDDEVMEGDRTPDDPWVESTTR